MRKTVFRFSIQKTLEMKILYQMDNFFDNITLDQKDAITEVINIGFGRAAASLSILIGSHIILQAPQVEIHSIAELTSTLESYAPREEIIIHQVFKGSITGDVLLFMDAESASVLVDMLSGGPGIAKPIGPSDREALIEVGNILMNSYIGSFGNLLNLKLSFNLPHMSEESLVLWLHKMNTFSNGERQYVVLVKTDFNVANIKASGYVALLLDLQSLKVLVETVEKGLQA